MIRFMKSSKSGTRRVAVGRAENHALGDERVAYGSDRGDLPIHDVGDVARSVGPTPECRHGSQVALLGRRQPIEAHAEKARVEFGKRLGSCALRVVQLDWGSIGDVPAMLAPLLEEVGIAVRPSQDFGDCVGAEGNALPGRRHRQGVAGVVVVETVDRRELEESFGVGLGVTGSPDQLRQSRRHHRDRQLLLTGAVQRRDQRGEPLFRHVLQFIDEEHDCGWRDRPRPCRGSGGGP